MSARVLLFWLLWPLPLAAQGFAGMGADAEGFALPAPEPEFAFPADHGPHPAFRIEWWYVTANLADADGTPYGLQWTLFRTALAPVEDEGWESPQVWFAHAAVTTPDAHFAAERYARGGIGQAGVIAEPFDAWIDEWRLAGPGFDELTLTARGPDFGYDMELSAEGPLIFQGEGGYSVKSLAGQASYYYSQPFYAIAGTLILPDGEVAVAGQAWLDREWSSQPLEEDQTGWDWFSLHFDGGDKLMLYQLRNEDGAAYTAATWIGADGTAEAVPDGFARAEPLAEAEVAGRVLPVRWRLVWPDKGLDVAVEALLPDAWNDLAVSYWEGPVTVTGSHSGRGYLEMTGYE